MWVKNSQNKIFQTAFDFLVTQDVFILSDGKKKEKIVLLNKGLYRIDTGFALQCIARCEEKL